MIKSLQASEHVTFPPFSSMSATIYITTTTVKTTYRSSLWPTQCTPDIHNFWRGMNAVCQSHMSRTLSSKTPASHGYRTTTMTPSRMIWCIWHIYMSPLHALHCDQFVSPTTQKTHTQKTIAIRLSVVHKLERNPLPLPPPKMLSCNGIGRLMVMRKSQKQSAGWHWGQRESYPAGKLRVF